VTGFELITVGDDQHYIAGREQKANMTTKQRLRKLRAECADWDQIIANLAMHGISTRDAERGILALIDAGLVRIEPRPGRPTAFILTTPPGLPEKVLTHVAE
jgi:hypothetical protein